MGYIRGHKRAKLLSKNVHVSWVKQPQVLKLTNHAFYLYYIGWNRARKVTSTDLRTRMGVDLTDAATSGMAPLGAYSADLETVLTTLAGGNDHWREDWGKNYCGPQITGALNVPVGVCNFLNAVDARAKTLQSAYTDLGKYLKDVQHAKKNKRWSDIGTYTTNIGKVVKESERCLWLTKGLDANLGSKWFDGVGKIHSCLSNFNKFQYELNRGTVPAIVLTSLVEVIKFGVPIFGEIYGKAIESIPALVKWATNIRDEREKTIRMLLAK